MRSTGEVMGVDVDFAIAYAKSQIAAGGSLPDAGNVFVSLRSSDKRENMSQVVRELLEMDFTVFSTPGTHQWLDEQGIAVNRLNKISEGRPHAGDMVKNGELQLIINTPTRKGMQSDEGKLRSTTVRYGVPMITTTTGAAAAVRAIAALRKGTWSVRTVQDYFPDYRDGALRREVKSPD
jgi:carbamoyl-phosphate synthase large subunit